MTTERLPGLALMNIHHEIPIDYDSLVQLFAERYPRRLPLVGPVVDETESKKDQIQYIFIIVLLFENLHRFTKVFSF